MILISELPAESMILSASAGSIIFSAGDAKQQSTKSCSGKCGDNGGGRGESSSGNGFDVGSGKDDCSEDSNGDGDGDGDSSNDNGNSNSGGGDSNSGRKNNHQLKAAVEKAVTAVGAALTSILLAS
jgi:hypothetical protein